MVRAVSAIGKATFRHATQFREVFCDTRFDNRLGVPQEYGDSGRPRKRSAVRCLVVLSQLARPVCHWAW